ncbi:MAG: DUF3631 domain-containing protein, partial [Acidobacteriota bacterium]|nr:DUF3631 domain-containing protein [Acidobacteriota bacterium]
DELLSGLVATFKRFIVGKEETMIAAALWVAMTWFIDIVHVAPLAVITAPDKRCGKSQLLAIMGKMVCRPLLASNVSSAALFRVIEAWRPTFLIDETDAFMKDNEELRGILNSGHTRDSAYVIRTVGDDHIPRRFSTWGAKALAGIGKLADTLMDRSIILEMRRKLRTEKIEKLRHAGRDLFSDQARKLARFASDNGDTMRLARPEIPASMNDRAQDNWEPLLAIADIAGGVWPKKARAAAVAISCGGEETASIGNELLADIQNVFEANRTDRIGTAELIKALCEDEEAPWNTYNRGKQISPRQMANRLKEYGVVSKTIRIGFQTAKGYELSQFDEAFSRYISPSSPGTPVSIRNSVTNHVNHSICNSYVVTDRAGTTAQSGLSVTPQIIENKELNPKCYVVTDRGADTEGYEEVVI